MSDLARFHLDAALGLLVLAWFVWSKLSELRLRQTAVKLTARVIKVITHRHATSVYVGYAWQGVERLALYRAGPLVSSYRPGDALEILVDPQATPDVVLPAGIENAPGAGVGGGTCSLPGERIISWLDLLYVGAAVFLIVRSFTR